MKTIVIKVGEEWSEHQVESYRWLTPWRSRFQQSRILVKVNGAWEEWRIDELVEV